MATDIEGILKKVNHFAEQATTEDKAQNYEVAAQAYMAASDWLFHALKYGTMSKPMKESMRAKLTSYVERAEKIKKMQENTSGNKESVAAVTDGKPSSSPNKNNNEDTGDPERKRLMQQLEGAIVTDPKITFDDVVGLEQAKEALREAAILPVKFPKLFRGHRKPWFGILLYGPPGTGKSYLAQAIATECKNTFISVTSADLLGRYLGEAEKNVRALFDLARQRQPCIVFIDEVDALCGQRNDTEHEASRRVKTEFLVQMNGVKNDNAGVLVLGATNLPWTLDTAMRRRFEKRIYISLPGIHERADMFKTHLGATTPHEINDHQWMELAEKSENYSGADIAVVCREALLKPIRRLRSSTHFKKVPNPEADGPREVWLTCSPGDPNAVSLTLDKIPPDDLCEPPVTMFDMLGALETQKATVGINELTEYQQFTKNFGQDGL